MDASSMSLDEIIQKKRTNGTGKFRSVNSRLTNVLKRPAKFGETNKSKRFGGNNGATGKIIIDARNKIIQKNRSKIRDARDKLAQITKRGGDARLKLMKKMHIQNKAPVTSSGNSRAYLPTQQQHQQQPHQQLKKVRRPTYTIDRRTPVYVPNQHGMMDIEEDFIPPAISLRRTVQNDIAYSNMPPLPTFPRSSDGMGTYRHMRPSPPPHQSQSMWNADPFDCYEVPIGRPADVSEPKNLHRQIRNIGAEMMPRKGILRPTRDRNSPPQQQCAYGPIIDDNSHLSYEMRARLERPPDVNVSMGIFSNPYASKLQQPVVAMNGYRIVVSNLHNSVSQSDIKELFEDIGELLEARLVRPGVAEVIFSTMKDAESAVDTYHNRQLDGQPMKCLLVNPRASSKPTAPAIKTRSDHSSKSGKTPLEIDIDALHKVLFRRN